jgi:hypothetical protein
VEDIAVIGVVTIQTPAVGLVVLEDDVGMHGGELTAVAVGRHARMAVGTRKDTV